MYDEVDKDATAKLIADILLREGTVWFKNLRPVDEEGKLRLPVTHDSERFKGIFLGGTAIVPAGRLAGIMEVRRKIYTDSAPDSRILRCLEAFCEELRRMPPDTPVAFTSICQGSGIFRFRWKRIITVYVDVERKRVAGLLVFDDDFVLA